MRPLSSHKNYLRRAGAFLAAAFLGAAFFAATFFGAAFFAATFFGAAFFAAAFLGVGAIFFATRNYRFEFSTWAEFWKFSCFDFHGLAGTADCDPGGPFVLVLQGSRSH